MKKKEKKEMEKGWECPKCGRVNAPWIPQCNCYSLRPAPQPSWTRNEMLNRPTCKKCGGTIIEKFHYC